VPEAANTKGIHLTSGVGFDKMISLQSTIFDIDKISTS
jgi:hypothetical protein